MKRFTSFLLLIFPTLLLGQKIDSNGIAALNFPANSVRGPEFAYQIHGENGQIILKEIMEANQKKKGKKCIYRLMGQKIEGLPKSVRFRVAEGLLVESPPGY